MSTSREGMKGPESACFSGRFGNGVALIFLASTTVATVQLSVCLQEIATEKAGIFKAGSPALTIPQEPEAQQALQVRAAD